MDGRLTDKASWCGVLQVIVLCEQRNYLGENGFAHELPFLVLGDDTWPHLDLLAHLESEGAKHSFISGKPDKTGIFRVQAEAELNPTLRTPFRILPPATPPFKSSTSHPGLFTSKDLMTERENGFMFQSDEIKERTNI